MALRQKRIIFVICPEPTDRGAGCSDACAAFYTVFYFFLVFVRSGGDYVVLGDFALIRFFQIVEFIFRLINYQTKSEGIN